MRIKYPKSGSYKILGYPKEVEMTERKWNDAIQGPDPLQKKSCGEFRYVGFEKILEFFITPNCSV